jgi:integrase
MPPCLDGADGFLKHPRIPQPDPMPEPFEAEEFKTIVEAAAKLRDDPAQRHLYLINLVLRQTGIRSGSVAELHKSWVRRFKSGPILDVAVVKGGTAAYNIDIPEALATLIETEGSRRLPGGAEQGYLLPGSATQRARLVHQHTRWLKTLVKETESLSEQANHRLRDTAGTIAYTVWGRAAAVALLGHADEEINRKNYAKLKIDVSDLMRAELAHVARLVTSTQPANVVPIEQGTAAA